MKKLIEIVFLVVFLTASIYSCNDSTSNIAKTEKFKPISKITEDSVFTNLLKSNLEIISQIEDQEVARKLIKKGKNITQKEVDRLAKALGFANRRAFIQNYKRTRKSIKYLNKTYNISQYSEEKIKSLAKKTEFSISEDTNFYREVQTETCEENCREIYTACAAAATGTAAGAHVGCGLADTTIVLGAVCHGAVYLTQVASLEVCRNQNQSCIRGCDDNE